MICDRSLHFPGIETYRQRINEAIDESNVGEKLTIIADMERVIEVDYTSLKVSSTVSLAFGVSASFSGHTQRLAT